MNATYRRILLTPDEMRTLDDGQDWYSEGDQCWLGGDIERTDGTDFACGLDLCVNGRTHDTWTYLHELSAAIRERLVNSTD